jgi:Saxitoxin biosynthesis operon protein SxtJ
MGIMKIFRTKISKDESRDTGMATVLLLLIVAASRKREGYLFVAMAVHVVNMVKPEIYRPIAVLWLGLSDLLGAVVSRILLSMVFLFVVTPISLLRRWLGKDSLKLRDFKTGQGSVMVERNHTFVSKDLERPY